MFQRDTNAGNFHIEGNTVVDREGLNPLYKFSGLAFLTYADKYRSMRLQKTTPALIRSINLFEALASRTLRKTECLSLDELIAKRILKRKHYNYGAYLAVVSSFPILSQVTDTKNIIDSIIAKTAEISSIKALDNLNDEYHSNEHAIKTMRIQNKAFTERDFNLIDVKTHLSKAENSIYTLATLTNQILSYYIDKESVTYRIFLEDLERYFKGQMDSMHQKVNENLYGKVGIRDFLLEVNEKGVGNVWIDIDFCLFEAFQMLNKDEYKTMLKIKKAIDLIFKACNVYDDIADFTKDMTNEIWNSVAYLALDQGYCDEDDLKQPPETVLRTLKKTKVFEEAIQLGDFIFLKGIEKMNEAKGNSKVIDLDALKFNARLLRIFAIRKWLFESKNPFKLLRAAKVSVSDKILPYGKYIV